MKQQYHNDIVSVKKERDDVENKCTANCEYLEQQMQAKLNEQQEFYNKFSQDVNYEKNAVREKDAEISSLKAEIERLRLAGTTIIEQHKLDIAKRDKDNADAVAMCSELKNCV